MKIRRTCLTHPLDLLQLVFARRRRSGRRGRRSVRRGRAQGRRRGPVVVLHLSLTALRGRNRSLSPQRNRMPRYGASNHVSCFSAVSEFQGTFSGPSSERESAHLPILHFRHSQTRRLSLGIYASSSSSLSLALLLGYITTGLVCKGVCANEILHCPLKLSSRSCVSRDLLSITLPRSKDKKNPLRSLPITSLIRYVEHLRSPVGTLQGCTFSKLVLCAVKQARLLEG